MVSIWKYGPDLLGKKVWTHTGDIPWAEYEVMAKNVPGEGATWKATFKF